MSRDCYWALYVCGDSYRSTAGHKRIKGTTLDFPKGMSLLIPSHKDLNPFSALEYAITVPDHRIDFLHIASDATAKPTVSVEEITEQRPKELLKATIDRLVDQVESMTDDTDRKVRLLHSPGPIGEATIRYADALQSDLIVLAVSGNEIKRDPNVNNAINIVTNNAPAAFTIIQE